MTEEKNTKYHRTINVIIMVTRKKKNKKKENRENRRKKVNYTQHKVYKVYYCNCFNANFYHYSLFFLFFFFFINKIVLIVHKWVNGTWLEIHKYLALLLCNRNVLRIIKETSFERIFNRWVKSSLTNDQKNNRCCYKRILKMSQHWRCIIFVE
jgi:hypothetical protein